MRSAELTVLRVLNLLSALGVQRVLNLLNVRIVPYARTVTVVLILRPAQRLLARSLRMLTLPAGALLLAGCAMVGGKPAPAPTAPAVPPAAAAPEPTPAAKQERAAAAYPTPAARAEPVAVDAATQRAFDAARQSLAAGRVAEAERAFAALAKSHPTLAGPVANLALIHRNAGRLSEAVREFERAIQLSPQRADLFNQLGITQRMAGEFGKAREAYERALALEAGDPVAVLNLGILHDLYLWDAERALALYERYLQINPQDEQVKRWVSDLRNRAGRNKAGAPPPAQATARKEQG
ncbi:MAG: tetratricopeptide repeat protein [Burkholderiaceae bacterium]|jgi:tetratricopeptide (TPR) repeat protein|nr:tetratricopeptide repeat protein [Burkholderiaceae bacterium]